MAKDVITRLKLENSNFNNGLSQSSKALDQFKQQGFNVDGMLKNCITSFAKFATAGAAVTGALKVAKDAFFQSEQNIDEWNRTMESAKGVYEGFLTALNTGDIRGYLSRIDEIVSAAREAYNELDRLSTQKAINNKKIVTQQSENQRMQMMLRTGRYIAPLDGTKAATGLKDGDKLTAEQLKNISKHLEGGMAVLRKYTQDEISQTTKSIESMYSTQAKDLGMTIDQFKKGTENMAEFDKVIEGAKKYQEYEANRKTTTIQSASGVSVTAKDATANPYQQYAAWADFLDDGQKFTKINELINQRASAQNSLISQYGQAYRGINKATGGGTGGGGGGSSAAKSYMSALEGIVDIIPKDTPIKFADGLLGEDFSKRMKENLQKTMTDMTNGIEFTPISDYTYDSAAELRDTMQGVAASLGSASSAMGQFANESEAAAVSQKAFSIAAAIATLVGQFASIPKGAEIWSWIAGTVAGTGTLIATIASLKSATSGYADGGLVSGGAFTGDAVPILANQGEIVLSAAMQRNLASNLQSNASGGGGRSTISGEQIVTVVNAYGRRTGRGEILR